MNMEMLKRTGYVDHELIYEKSHEIKNFRILQIKFLTPP